DGSRITLPARDEATLADLTSDVTIVGTNDENGPYYDLGRSAFSGTLDEGSFTSERPPAYQFFTLAAMVSDHVLEVFNAVSANGDTRNDFLRIDNIEFYPENTVKIHNRWG